uniref:Homing endonuclease LAGLIDADG domain-containing protein n=1 Tax=Orbilia brochopaga TaxID=3140254 RepID=A0A4Y5MX82_9PEZI|nr:hypothetical protein [Drechslerella brochopaga]
MVFPTRKARFLTFLSSFNEKLLRKNLITITPLDICVTPSLKDGWISGITDGEGCFTCSLLSNSSGYRFRYILTQKWEANKFVLEHIINIFSEYLVEGSVVTHSVNDVWEIRINGVKNCKGLFTYFDEYSLITKKKDSYLKWKLLHSRLSKIKYSLYHSTLSLPPPYFLFKFNICIKSWLSLYRFGLFYYWSFGLIVFGFPGFIFIF